MRWKAQLTPHGTCGVVVHAHDEHLGEMRQTMLDAVTVRSRISPICRSSYVYHSTMLRSAVTSTASIRVACGLMATLPRFTDGCSALRVTLFL